MAKNRSKASGRWLQEHFDDHYVKQAQRLGYRSRAAFKLLEINEKDKLVTKGQTIIDLGAAPGGWSQILAPLVGSRGRLVATDILPMDHLGGVEFLQGDFTQESVFEQLLQLLGADGADLVFSDMAPNLSGMRGVDQPRAMYLAELALDLAIKVLKPGGGFVCKVFHGEGFDQYMIDMRQHFNTVVTRKPAASRPRSREVYAVAKGLKRTG
ncbi:MAG: 23S rRNA (uridine(2552)-2'-O)-methyltransferase RlmE [Pseudomonadales bacterium]|nr:23S rRNA (uridine(2552)-2'-O)-methyltransferase RlmE [Gammaproteobacteria bacterium]NNL56342.1 23S rRNA (uridine(2552)-2'-O)-methyltransferase RlmE [Pseudomonadales bacterium]